MATKTNVLDGGAVISGTLRVQNQTVHPVLVSAPTTLVGFTAGGMSVYIQDISTSGWSGSAPGPSPPMGTLLTFAVWIESADLVDHGHEFVYISGAGDDDIERDFTYSIDGRRIWRTESASPGSGRVNSPVYATEVTETDAWQDEPPVSWTITLGSLTWSGAAGTPPPPPEGAANSGLSLHIDQHKGNAGVVYAQIKNLKWDDADVNLSRYHYPAPKPATGIYLDGKVGGFDVECVTNSSLARSVGYGLPFIVDFSDFSVRQRSGVLIGDARIDGGFTASAHVPSSLTWSTDP